jgi:hypothetical protein
LIPDRGIVGSTGFNEWLILLRRWQIDTTPAGVGSAQQLI